MCHGPHQKYGCGVVPIKLFKHSSILFDPSKKVLPLCIFIYVSRLSLFLTVMSVPCSLVITNLERADLLALICVIFFCFYHLTVWCLRSGVVVDCIHS